jgi:hypothetical protein
LTARGGVYHDGDVDFSVTYVLGPEASPQRRDDIVRMLDSLRFTP